MEAENEAQHRAMVTSTLKQDETIREVDHHRAMVTSTLKRMEKSLDIVQQVMTVSSQDQKKNQEGR